MEIRERERERNITLKRWKSSARFKVRLGRAPLTGLAPSPPLGTVTLSLSPLTPMWVAVIFTSHFKGKRAQLPRARVAPSHESSASSSRRLSVHLGAATPSIFYCFCAVLCCAVLCCAAQPSTGTRKKNGTETRRRSSGAV